MKSFNESLQITKNFNLIAEAMQLLQAHGIDPNLLADWIENEAVYANQTQSINESLNNWLSEQDWTSGSGHVDINKATIDLQNALGQLSKRAQTSQYLRSTVTNPMFAQNINALVASLRANLQQKGGQHYNPKFHQYYNNQLHYPP